MDSLGIWHWILILVIFLLLFGGGRKISEPMGDFASFKGGGDPDGFA